MPGGVEEIDDVVVISELHHRTRHRNTATFLDIHPIAGGVATALACFDRARHLDRTAKKQQLFGEGSLTRIGMGDDGKGAPTADLVDAQGARQRLGSFRHIGQLSDSVEREGCSAKDSTKASSRPSLLR